MGWNSRPNRQISVSAQGQETKMNVGGQSVKTQDYRTKTMFINHKNPCFNGAWGVAVDIGYSGTKIFSPDCVACFPSFATPVNGSLISLFAPDEATILYRDGESGAVWRVGKTAQENISIQDVDQNSTSIYGRQWYYSPMYLVIARTALGIACRGNGDGGPGDRKIYLQTGLPNQYLETETADLLGVLTGTHIFDIKVGASDWKHFEIELNSSNIGVMSQPLGTLLSISTENSGAHTPDHAKYGTLPMVIFDPGFGTMDCFSLRGNEIKKDDISTTTEFTMRKVLEEASNKIYKEYQVRIPVPAMQKYLDLGFITKFDRKQRKGTNVDFGNILEEATRHIASLAIDKLCELYNNFLEYNYLVVTGGTGEAWYPYFVEAFEGMPNLTLVPGNKGTEGFMDDGNGGKAPLPFFFSNVRGYYFYLQSKLAREHRAS